MGNAETKTTTQRLTPIGNNFWNVRSRFVKFKGLVDIGTHMSIIKLANGNYLLFSTVPLTDDLKQEIDALTDNGKKIEAFVAKHPFHPLAFPGFYQAYPNVPFYGTPRHIRVQKDIKWTGDVNDVGIQKKWEPEVFMRIPAGAEFVAPVPESYNHFNCMWVFHPESKTIHVDDTINYFSNPSMIMKVAGKKKGCMEFHDSLKGPALFPKPESPKQLKEWCDAVIKDWDFDNMCCAHIGNKIGGAKDSFKEVLANSQPLFDKLTAQFTQHAATHADDEEAQECAKYNVDGNECG